MALAKAIRKPILDVTQLMAIPAVQFSTQHLDAKSGPKVVSFLRAAAISATNNWPFSAS
jgi:hypothetical protein